MTLTLNLDAPILNFGEHMKLYWRVKKNGKWTWVAAVYDLHEGECTHENGELVTLWWPTDGDINEIEMS